jgi:hypothetical protein
MRKNVTMLGVALSAITGLLAGSTPAGWAQTEATSDPAAAGLVKKAVEALPKVPFQAKLVLTNDKGDKRDVELRHKVVGGARASFLEVVAPEELKGIRFLFLERPTGAPDQYVKIATARSPVRVTDQIRKQPFLDSTFYVSDLVEPNLELFNYRFLPDTGIGGHSVKQVEAVPKYPEGEIYGKTLIAIDPTDLVILRREFYDKNGKLLKVWTVDVVEKVEGVNTIRDQRMKNVQENKESRLQTPEIKYNVELSDAMFAPDHLKK